MSKIIVKALLLMFLTGLSCTTFGGDYVHRPKQDIVDAKVPSKSEGASLSLEDVRTAILSACNRRGWATEIKDQNLIRASLVNRDHFVEVNISFSLTNYSINYLSSRKMDYQEKGNLIHVKYNIWLEMLSKDIQNQLFLSLLSK